MYLCIGVPYFVGEYIEGRDEVAKIQASGIAAELGAEWINIEPDFNQDSVIAVNQALAAVIAAHPDHTPLIFACCCTSALGAMKGLETRSPAILWYDAHGDFNTPETTPSGFLGGMPLAMLTGRGDMRYMQGIGLSPIAESDVIITDARDLDPEEAVMLRESAVTHLPEISALASTPLPEKPLYIHFDTDIIRLEDMPGMSYPASGGPTLTQATESLRNITQRATIAGILFSLWNDTLPTEGKSLESTLALLRTLT